MNFSELYWQRITPLHLLLWPASLFYIFGQRIRRYLYRRTVFASARLPIPVIVIDSITTKSAAKISLIIQITESLRAIGLRPGIISRGHPDNYHSPTSVTIAPASHFFGETPLLLRYYLRETCPIWTGYDRVKTAKALLQAHQECNVLICEDGLQDLRLQRDYETVVVDTNIISTGNGLVMPAGPLRDSFARLQLSDAVILAGYRRNMLGSNQTTRVFQVSPGNIHFFNLLQPKLTANTEDWAEKSIYAIIRDSEAQTFLDHLEFSKLTVTSRIFSDDHQLTAADFPDDEDQIILISETDTVKCLHQRDQRIWVLQQIYLLPVGLRTSILKKLREKFMDPKLLDILVCPLCKGPLRYQKEQSELICKADRLAFPIRDGIPVMLEDEARRIPDEEEIQ